MSDSSHKKMNLQYQTWISNEEGLLQVIKIYTVINDCCDISDFGITK